MNLNTYFEINRQKHGIQGSKNVGTYRLMIPLSLHLMSKEKEPYYEFKNFRCRVFLKGMGYLGIADPWSLTYLNNEYSQNHPINFFIDLNNEQILEIEKNRNHKSLSLKLNIECEVVENGKSMGGQIEYEFEIQQSEWINVLKQMNYMNYLLFEIPMVSHDNSQQFHNAVNFLTKANEALYEGKYSEVIANCRKAIESVIKSSDLSKLINNADNQYLTNRKLMTKEDRELIIINAIQNYTHLGHHTDNDGAETTFYRPEANFILGATVELISKLSHNLFI